MMKLNVSIDKFTMEYKDVPHGAFLRLYMMIMVTIGYKVKMKYGYEGALYVYELHIKKDEKVYMHIYYRNFNEITGHMYTLRIETRPEHYAHFSEILEFIRKRAKRINFVSCDVAYDIPTKLENVVVIPIDVRRKMSHCETTRYFGEGYQRKQNGYCRIYDKRLELFRNKGIYLENDLSRIEVVYKPDEKIELKDIERHSPKQNKQYFAAVIMDWQALEKKEVERVINLRDGKDMYTQYIRRAIKKPLANQYRVDFDELAGAVWKQLIGEPCSMVLGVV